MFESVILSVSDKRCPHFPSSRIGNTTMDATLSFVMANMAQCQANHIALDPFCGTGESFYLVSLLDR